MKKLTSPAVLKQILADSGFRFSKSLGQNFLISDSVLEDMIYSAGIDDTSNVLDRSRLRYSDPTALPACKEGCVR